MALNINGTTGISGVDGSASAPALQGSDSNTGVSFGTDTVNINTGGSTRATVDSSGQLSISGSTGAFDTTGSLNGLQLYYESDQGIATLGSYSSGGSTVLNFHTNSGGGASAERMRIDSSGKLGVGTTSPASIFHTSSSGDHVVTHQTTTSGADIRLNFRNNSGTDAGGIHYLLNGNALKFIANSNEYMRIASNGWIYFNSQNASSNNGRVYINRATSSNSSLEINQNTGGGTEFMAFRCEGSQIGSITQSGASNTSYNTSSDYRLKENISLISDGITRLKQLKPSRFNWKIDDTNTPQDGFIAHEVSSVIPEAVQGEKDAVFTEDTGVGTDNKGAINPQKLDYSKFTPLLTAALQEAIAKIEVLETKVAALEAA